MTEPTADKPPEAKEEPHTDLPPILQFLATLSQTQVENVFGRPVPPSPHSEEDPADTRVIECLRDVMPEFSGSLNDFKMDESLKTEYLRNAPSFIPGIVRPEVKLISKHTPKGAEDVRALDANLADAVSMLLASSAYLMDALRLVTDDMDEALSEGLFRSFCLMAQSISRLQIERYTTPKLRAKINEEAGTSDVPAVVQKAKKGRSKQQSESSDDSYSDRATPPMVKVKRPPWRLRKTFFRKGPAPGGRSRGRDWDRTFRAKPKYTSFSRRTTPSPSHSRGRDERRGGP
jgi:hypothetical protein